VSLVSASLNRKDVASAAVCLLSGAFFAIQSLRTLQLGSAARMGPGYFPLFVGGILIALGLVLAIRAIGEKNAAALTSWAPLRGLLSILGAPVVFGLTVRSLGFAPALFLTALISTFASDKIDIRRALFLAVVLTGFCCLLFSFGLGINLPLLGPWASKLGLAP
jgi:hypothetical protein